VCVSARKTSQFNPSIKYFNHIIYLLTYLFIGHIDVYEVEGNDCSRLAVIIICTVLQYHVCYVTLCYVISNSPKRTELFGGRLQRVR